MKSCNRFRVILFASSLILSPAIAQKKVFIIPGGPSWPCTLERKDLPQLMRIQKRMVWESENPSDLRTNTMQHLADTLIATRSIMVGTKDRVTILTSSSGAHRVSVTSRSGHPAWYQEKTSRGCWIDASALNGAKIAP